MKNENEKSKKFNIVIYLLVLVALFTMFIGTSYAYYIKTIKNGDETKVVIKSSNMLLRFYDGNQINAYDIEPNWESTYNFSIENYSPDTAGKYKIIFDIEKPLTDSIEDNFVFELTGKSSKNNKDKLVIKNEQPVPISSTELGVGNISVGSLHDYELKLKLKDNGKDQNYLNGKVFIAKITVFYVYE